MVEPRISVVMPVHNEERSVREAVRSILEQSFGDFECIIVDDGSTDATASILASLNDPRLRVLRNAHCQGIQRALRRGMEAARGEFIARQDGDDISAPGRFAAQVRWLEAHPDCVLIGTGGWIDLRDGSRHLGLRLHRIFPVLAEPHAIAVRLIFGFNDVVHTSVMFRRCAIAAAGGYSDRPEHLGCEDYELWRRLVAQGLRLDNLRRPLVVHRIAPNRRAAARIATRRPEQNVVGIAADHLRSLLGYLPGAAASADLLRILSDAYGLRRTQPASRADPALLRRVLGDVERSVAGRWPGSARAIARTFFLLRLRLHLVRRLPAPMLRLMRISVLAAYFARSLLSRVCFRPRPR